MKKKIILVEYMGICNKDGIPIGHSYKVLEEYCNMIKAYFQVAMIIPQNAKKMIFDAGIVETYLRHYIVMRDKEHILSKMRNLWYKYENFKAVFQGREDTIFWFYNIDFSLLLYLLFYKKNRKRVVCNLYRRNFGKSNFIGRIKNKLADHVLKEIGIAIFTGKEFLPQWKNSFYMPDYYFIPEKYNRYINLGKKKKVVCLGNMNRFKLLDETVDAFNKIGYDLEIIGKFYDTEWKKQLEQKANKNILIKDIYLSDEEYLHRLGEAQYCIIPYNFAMYNHRTSGILQECIFLKTIPVTFKWFLEQNNAQGIGVSNLDDITKERLDCFDILRYGEWCDVQIKEEYNFKKIRNNFIARMELLTEEKVKEEV